MKKCLLVVLFVLCAQFAMAEETVNLVYQGGYAKAGTWGDIDFNYPSPGTGSKISNISRTNRPPAKAIDVTLGEDTNRQIMFSLEYAPWEAISPSYSKYYRGTGIEFTVNSVKETTAETYGARGQGYDVSQSGNQGIDKGYWAGVVTGSTNAMTDQKKDWLVDLYQHAYEAIFVDGGYNYDAAYAFQLAIWEIMEENDGNAGLSLSDGNFAFRRNDPYTINPREQADDFVLANSWLDSLMTGEWGDDAYYNEYYNAETLGIFTNDDWGVTTLGLNAKQFSNLIGVLPETYGKSNPTPEPATIAILGLGVLGAGFYRRSRKA